MSAKKRSHASVLASNADTQPSPMVTPGKPAVALSPEVRSYRDPEVRWCRALILFFSKEVTDVTSVQREMTPSGLVVHLSRNRARDEADATTAQRLDGLVKQKGIISEALLLGILTKANRRLDQRLRCALRVITAAEFNTAVDTYAQSSATTGRIAVTKNTAQLRTRFQPPDLFATIKHRMRSVMTKCAELQHIISIEGFSELSAANVFITLAAMAEVSAHSIEGMCLCDALSETQRAKIATLRRRLNRLFEYRMGVNILLQTIRRHQPQLQKLPIVFEWHELT